MLNFFKKPKESFVVSPVDGTCISLSQVPDKMFSEKLLGDGVAFVFETESICSPTDGVVTMIAATKHAFGITDVNGLEILVHIGLDTVELNGEGFEVLVKVNQKVKAGTPIVKLNRKFIEEHSINLITPVILTNGSSFEISKEKKNAVKIGDQVMTAFAK